MKFDCIVIGGGVAGLTCAIKCSSAGLRTAVISAGMNALHFSSGSIDVLGFDHQRKVVYHPFDAIKDFIEHHPQHPFARCGVEFIEQAMYWFQEIIGSTGPELYRNDRQNHFSVTALGTLKPTYLSQKSVFNEQLKQVFAQKPKIALLTIDGFRDFYPSLAAANHQRAPLIRDCKLVTGTLNLSEWETTTKNPHELRSIDLCRIFDTNPRLTLIADEILRLAQGAKIVGIPAILGIQHYAEIHRTLEQLTGCLIYEIPTLPPSILGLRLDNALKEKLADLGGIFIAGDQVEGGEQQGGQLISIRTKNYGNTALKAAAYLLATGSYFSGGISTVYNQMKEPIFNLALDCQYPRNKWYAPQFLDQAGHPFLEFGVRTDENFHPFDVCGRVLENVFCAGAVLSGYNPVKEGSGSGTAISTALFAADQIISHIKGKHATP